jgi:hypothetical protein
MKLPRDFLIGPGEIEEDYEHVRTDNGIEGNGRST